jgi:hypothetical protein
MFGQAQKRCNDRKLSFIKDNDELTASSHIPVHFMVEILLDHHAVISFDFYPTIIC